MPEYLSPGVYIEEIDAGPTPIEGVSTSTAAAAGVTARGPSEGAPVLVTSFNDFRRTFGGFYAPPEPGLRNAWTGPEGGYWWRFPLAVKGFFDNGGQRLYVKRVLPRTATFAAAKLDRGLILDLARDAAADDDSIELSSLVGVSVGTTLEIHASGSSFPVTAYDPASGEVSLDTGSAPGIGETLIAGRDRVIVHAVASGASDKTVEINAVAKGEWGNDLWARIRPMYGATGRLLPALDPAVAGDAASTTLASQADGSSAQIDVSDTAGFTSGDHVSIDGAEYEITSVGPGTPGTLDLDPTPPTLSTGTTVRRLRPAWDFAAATDTASLRVSSASSLYVGAVVELDAGGDKFTTVIASITGDVVEFENDVGIALREGHRLRAVEARVDLRWDPGDGELVEESFTNLRLIDDGSPAFITTLVNRRSELVRIEAIEHIPGPSPFPLDPSLSDLSDFPISPDGGWIQLESGDDKLGALTIDDFAGQDGGPGQRTGVRAFEEIDEISICTVPCVWAPLIHDALIIHCELLEDRVAILDVAPELDIGEVRGVREALSSSYAALYYPWIEVRDPLAREDVGLAPSAHLAGIYARVDNERGVFKAPANEVVRGISRIAQRVTKREQDLLNPEGINALRQFPGRGNRVWGARTLAANPSWKYISVRRLFLYVEESIAEATAWVVFEPNAEPLWARLRATVSNFLTTVWRSGALQGTSAEQAFFVRCDRSTMTQADIDNGRLICVIGIAPVKPAEFVIFRIQQKTIEAEA